MQSRFRSRTLWVSLLSFIGLILKLYFDFDLTKYNLVVDSLLIVLTAAGLFNNPKDPKNF